MVKKKCFDPNIKNKPRISALLTLVQHVTGRF